MVTNPAAGRRVLPAAGYIGLVVAAGALVLGLSLRNIAGQEYGSGIAAWAALAILTVLVGRLSLRLPLTSCIVSFSDAFIFLSFLMFGPDLATVTATVDGYAASQRSRGTWLKRAFNTAGMALSVNLSSRLFMRMVPAGRGLGAPGFSPAALLLPMVVLVGAHYLINTALVAGVVSLRDGVPFVTVWRESSPWSGTALLAGSAAAAVVFLVTLDQGAGAFLAIVPFPGVLYLTYRASLNGKLKDTSTPSRG